MNVDLVDVEDLVATAAIAKADIGDVKLVRVRKVVLPANSLLALVDLVGVVALLLLRGECYVFPSKFMVLAGR